MDTSEERQRDAQYELWREGYGEHYVRPKDAWDAGWQARASQEPHPASGELRERALKYWQDNRNTGGNIVDLMACFAASERGQWVSVEQAIVNFPLGHNHWDHTMQHGAECELCQSQYEAKQALLALVRSFAPPADKKEE